MNLFKEYSIDTDSLNFNIILVLVLHQQTVSYPFLHLN